MVLKEVAKSNAINCSDVTHKGIYISEKSVVLKWLLLSKLVVSVSITSSS